MKDPQPHVKPAKRTDSAPLDALRIVLKQQAVSLTPVINQVSALPIDDALEYYFVPMEYMRQYQAYYRPGKPYKNLKLVNYEKPAISLSFFYKHKYSVQRTPTHEEVMLHLRNHRDELLNRSLMAQLSAAQNEQLQQTDQILRTLRDNPQAYKACFSNYHHYYRYWYCAYRYFEDATLTKAASGDEHLLKHTERIKGQIHERLNIIFIDPYYITRPVPNDNKFVDRELDTFPIQLRQGITTLYLRKEE
ncbi:hypothetical protein [Spirosoma koreense]